MVHYCCCFGCNEKFVKGGRITFHSFPKEEARRKLWLKNIRRQNFVPSSYAKVCSKHFAEDCFDREKLGGVWLKADAVPTIFNFPEQVTTHRKLPEKRRSNEIADNFQDMCRLCMKQQKNMSDIFTEDKRLSIKLFYILPKLEMRPGDGLPPKVCRECVKQVNASHLFLTQCEVSDSTLRKYVNKQIICGNKELLEPTVNVKQKESSYGLDIGKSSSSSSQNLHTKVQDVMSEPSNKDSATIMQETQNLDTCKLKRTHKQNKCAAKLRKTHNTLANTENLLQIKTSSDVPKPKMLLKGNITTPKIILQQVKDSSPIQKGNITEHVILLGNNCGTPQPQNTTTADSITSTEQNPVALFLQLDNNVTAPPLVLLLKDNKTTLPPDISIKDNQEQSNGGKESSVATTATSAAQQQDNQNTLTNLGCKYLIPVQLQQQNKIVMLQNTCSAPCGLMSGKVSNVSGSIMCGKLSNGSDQTVSGKLSNGSDQTVSGKLSNWSDQTVSGKLSNGSDQTVSGKLSNGSDQTVSGKLSNGSDQTVSGKLSNGSDQTVSGKLSNWSDQTVSGKLSNGSDQSVSGKLSNGSDQTVSGKLSNGSDQSVSGKLSNGSDQTVSGKLSNGSDQTVSGKLSNRSDQTVSGKLSNGCDQTVSGKLSNGSDQTVPGKLSNGSDQTVPGKLSNGSDQTVPGKLSNGSDQTVSGKLSNGCDQTVSGKLSNGCDETVSGKLSGTLPVSAPSQPTCKECGRKFANKGIWFRHQQAHKVHNCEYCGLVFRTPSKLKLHRRKHTGEKLVRALCEKCGMTFTDYHSYVKHDRSHRGIKPFQCPICKKFCSSKRILVSHLRIHTGEKPVICEKCGVFLRDTTALIKHKSRRHEEKKRRYKCKLCPKAYINRTSLTIHLVVHSGERAFKCPKCDNAFAYKALLTRHMVVHTGERNYECPYCHKKFTTSSSRMRHVRMHTGDTPYKCDDCGRIFSVQPYLKNHRIKVHGKQE